MTPTPNPAVERASSRKLRLPAAVAGVKRQGPEEQMSVYVVANLVIRDREEYGRYVRAFMPVFREFGGEVLSVQDSPQAIEGSWRYSRTVLLRLPSEQHLRAWFESPGYQAIAKHRWNAAESDVVVLKEFAPSAKAP
jgi:uncharacterized protein (DUF1330 family)